MRRRLTFFAFCVALLSALPGRAQLTPAQTDALSKLQTAQSSAACSATEASACAEAARKLMPLILGDSPMIENLRRLTSESDGRVTGTPEMAKAVQWGIAGFRAAGLDVHTERYTSPTTGKDGRTNLHGPAQQENVVGEIRGYEKPDEVVILGAHLDSREFGTGALDSVCNAALVIEAARAIKAMGLVPKRTIRFVLFSGAEPGTLGSFAYVKTHASELDKIRALIVFDSGSGRTTGFSLGGRTDTEMALEQILKPLQGWGVTQNTAGAPFGSDNFDFLLEGVPTFAANQEVANYHAGPDTFDKVDQRELKLNTVIAALTAWGIADRAEPVGKRLSRGELDELVKRTGLDEQMKTLGYWEQWQNGTRGRKP